MRKLSKETSSDFIEKVNALGGANVLRVDIRLDVAKEAGNYANYILINAQLENSNTVCQIKLSSLVKYKIFDSSGIDYYGLSGDPESLVIIWNDKNPVLALGSILSGMEYEDICKANFFVEAKTLEYELVEE